MRRVLTRLMGIRKRAPESYFWEVMSFLISRRASSSFNQGMMELGALVCTPSQPRCPQCPVRPFCRARKLGIESEIPKAVRKQVPQRIGIVILVLERNSSILLTSGEKESFIPGAWALPCRQIPNRISKDAIASALCREILGQDIGLEFCGNIRHNISNRQITGFGFYGKVGELAVRQTRSGVRWAAPSILRKLLTSSIIRPKKPDSLPYRRQEGYLSVWAAFCMNEMTWKRQNVICWKGFV